MEKGDFIGYFAVEEEVRPRRDGHALLKVRYEGSYVRGYLCAVDVRKYGWDGEPEDLAQKLEAARAAYSGAGGGKKGFKAGVLLPEHISVRKIEGGGAEVLGFFLQKAGDAYLKRGPAPLTLAYLEVAAAFLTKLHAKGLGIGSLHPLCACRTATQVLFPCPLFPAFGTDEKTPWLSGLDEGAVGSDRRAFALLVADALTGNVDVGGFSKRLDAVDTYVNSVQGVDAFLADRSVTCESLVEKALLAEMRSEERRRQRRVLKRRTVGLTAAAVIALLAGGAFYAVQRSALAGAREAQALGRWEVCAERATAVLVINPWHSEAKDLKAHSLRALKTASAMAAARAARAQGQWRRCVDFASEALAAEPGLAEAVALKSDSEHAIRVAAAESAARAANRQKDWQACLDRVSEVLALDPGNAEALAMKAGVERAMKRSAALTAAQSAKQDKKWQVCLENVSTVLVLEPGDVEALALKTEAERAQACEAALALAQRAKKEKLWSVCLDKVSEVLALEPGNAEALGLKVEALGVLSAAQEVKAEEERVRKRLVDALIAARIAKADKQWNVCMAQATEALSLRPGHTEALGLKAEAERAMKCEAALASAQHALQENQWQVCLDGVSEVLLLEPVNAEALRLKVKAEAVKAQEERAKKMLSDALVAARMAKANQQWQVCADKSAEALALEPGQAEALGLMAEAERAMKAAEEEARQLAEQKAQENLKKAEVSQQPLADGKAAKRLRPAAGEAWVSPAAGMAFVWVSALKMWVGKYEVTNGEYRKMVPGHDSKAYLVHDLNGDRQPVVYMNFNDATAYAAWLTERDKDRLGGLCYRLPSDAEWQAFAQCGDEREFPWGNSMPPKFGNYGKISDYDDGYVVTCPVEKSGANEWGLYGVGGNVWECAAMDGDAASFGAWRGASWAYHFPVNLSCEFRGTGNGSRREDDHGFRLVLSQ